MLTLHRIDRLTAAGRDADLLDAVLANGRPLPLSARLRLGRPGTEAVAGPGLALIRRLELAGHADGPATRALAARLLERLTADRPPDPLAEAVGLAALGRLRDTLGEPAFADLGLDDALDHAAHALTTAMDADRAAGGPGLLGSGPDAGLNAAVALWLLADTPGDRAQALKRDLVRALSHARALDPDARAVARLAFAGAPVRTAA